MTPRKTPFFVGTYEPENIYNQRRYAFTLEFLGRLQGNVLDCGEANLLKSMIEKQSGIQITSTGEKDLDIASLEGNYDAVLAFEIIEHLMNPLWLLLQAKKVLKPGGMLYLSTPINKPKFLWRHDHFHEFDEYRLSILVEKAGFEIVRKVRKRFYYLTGVRPLLRWALKTGTMFLQLRAIESSSFEN